MQKADIARHIRQHVGISQKEAATLLEWILGLLKITLQKGEQITIYGFGKFTVRRKLPRTARNPRTGEAVMISARRVVTFHPSLVFTTEMNSVPADRQEAGNPPSEGQGLSGEPKIVDYRATLLVTSKNLS